MVASRVSRNLHGSRGRARASFLITSGIFALASAFGWSVTSYAFAAKVASPKTLTAPKRPSSSYMLWLNENRARLVKQVGGNSVSEVAKAAGAEWKALKPASKTKYEKQYAEAKATYAKALESFKASGGVIEPRKKKADKKAKAVKDPNAPKRPLSAYFLWMKDNRAAIVKKMPAGAKGTEVMKECGAGWSKATAATKSKYQKMSDAAKAVYEKEKAAYKAPKA